MSALAGAWLLLLLEFQSRADTDMALRTLGYVVELYRDLEAQGVVQPGTRRPPVLPVVIHNGESPWSAPVQVADLIALPRVPAQVRRDLRALQPSQRLHVVDFPRHRQDDLVPGNVVSLQIGGPRLIGPIRADCSRSSRPSRTAPAPRSP